MSKIRCTKCGMGQEYKIKLKPGKMKYWRCPKCKELGYGEVRG